MTDWPALAARGFELEPGELEPGELEPGEPEAGEPEQLPALVEEAWALLGDADPQRRNWGYPALVTWTAGGALDRHLLRLGQRAAAALDLGAAGSTVQRRSYAALVLSEVVGRDAYTTDSGVTPERVHAWVGDWAAWYPNEPDTRSLDPQLGWLHAVAHGADLGRQLALHPWVTRLPLRQLLFGVQERLASLAEPLFQTEDDRMALMLLSVLSRPELEEKDVQRWLDLMAGLWLSAAPGPVLPGPMLAVRTLYCLHVQISLGVELGGLPLTPAREGDAPALLETLRSVYPYYRQAEGQEEGASAT